MRTEEEKREFISAGTDDRNLMVEAGAGAGKTHLLVDRILNQIEQEVCEIQEIVAITFTRKAASEMKERLQKALMERFEKCPDSSSLKKAIENVHRMNISTIHSFCAEMIRSRPCDCQAGMEYDLLEAEDFEIALAGYERAYLAEDHVEDSELANWISDLRLYPNLKKDFDRVLLNDSFDFRIPGKSEFRSILSEFREKSTDIFHRLKELLAYGESEKLAWRKNIKEYAKEAVVLFDLYQKTESGCELRTFLSAVEKMLKEGLISSKNKWSDLKKGTLLTTRNGEEAHRKEIELLEAIQNCWEKRDAMEYALCVWSLQDFKEYYEKKNLTGATVLSNSELLYYALRIAEKEDARRYFQRRYLRFYIDEFQDTDPVQAKLFLSLSCENSGDLRDVPMEALQMLPGRLFVVGDPKQSIYRFRGADLNVYNRVKQIFLTQETAELIELDKTFRYHEGLGKEVTSIFSQTKEDHYGFGESSPSGIGFTKIQTDRAEPLAEMFQGLYVISSNSEFMMIMNHYLNEIEDRLKTYCLQGEAESMFAEYATELKETLATLYLKRTEKFISFEPTEKSGNRFKKDFLQKVWELLERSWKGEGFDAKEEELFSSLQKIGGAHVRQCESFQTCLALLELRLTAEETIEEEVQFLSDLLFLKNSEGGKTVTSEDKKSPLLKDLKEGMISEIPEAVRRTVLELVGTRKIHDGSSKTEVSVSISLRDILILTRQKDMLSKIGAALREAGIPYQSTEQRVFEEYAAIRTLLTVAEFIVNSSTDRLLRLLSTCYGWTSKELKAFQTGVELEKRTLNEENEEDLSFASKVENWERAARNLSQVSSAFLPRKKELDSLLELLYFNSESVNNIGMETPLAILENFLLHQEVLLYGMDPSGHEGENQVNAAYLFLQLLRDGAPVTAEQVSERMRTLIKRSVEHQFVPDVEEDALRLMNLHKAKGLEGKIVLLVGEVDHAEKSGPYFDSRTDRAYLEFSEAREKKGNHQNKIDYENGFIPKEEIEQAKEASLLEAKEEKIRLDYVALTRAREAAVVLDPKGCYDTALLKALHLQTLELNNSNLKLTFTKKRRAPRIPKRREPYATAGGVFLKTPSDIEALDISLHGTDRSRPTGAEFGTMVHRIFELMVRARLEHRALDIEHAMKFSVEEFLRENAPTSSLANLTLMGEISFEELKTMELRDRIASVFRILKDKTLSVLTNVWSQKVSPLLDESVKVYTELPFVLAVPANSPAAQEMSLRAFDSMPEHFLVRGKMDLVLKRENGEYLICDFKTNIKTNGMRMEAFRASLEEKYRYQMKLYRTAVQELYGVPEEKVRTLILDLYM